MQPDLQFIWDARTAVQLSVPGEERVAGKIVTNIGRGVRVELRVPRNELTPTMIDRLGEEVEIKPGTDYDRLVFWLNSLSQNESKQLRSVWRRCRQKLTVPRMQSA